MAIRTHEIGNKISLQYGHLDNHEVSHSSIEESVQINGLVHEKLESDNQPLQSGYRSIRSKESANKSHRYGVMCENKNN